MRDEGERLHTSQQPKMRAQPHPNFTAATIIGDFWILFHRNIYGASTATSSITFLRNNKGTVEGNSHNKAEGCISQKGNVKILFSHNADTYVLGLHER